MIFKEILVFYVLTVPYSISPGWGAHPLAPPPNDRMVHLHTSHTFSHTFTLICSVLEIQLCQTIAYAVNIKVRGLFIIE